MESAQNLKRRIRSVQNIGQITKAMEMVAATKMRRSQELALTSRPYAYAARELLGILSGLEGVTLPDLLTRRTIEKTTFLMVTSDKGLAGSFNSAVIRAFEQYVKENDIDTHDPKYSFVAVGQKAKGYFERRKMNLVASFTRAGDFKKIEETEPIANRLISLYLDHDTDQVLAFFTTFVTALRQDAVMREWLPVSYESIKQSIEETIPRAGRYADYAKSETFLDEDRNKEYLIEPSPADVLEDLAPQLLKIRIYHSVLEANASEHSARRMAMKNASDNAAELSQDLNMIYNKSRQASITNQIIEVTSGAQAT